MKINEVRKITENGWKPAETSEFSVKEYEGKIENVMSEVPSFTLITLNDNGMPEARAMSLKACDGIKRVWFATHRSSEHAAKIMKDPRVTIFFNSISANESLMLSGPVHVEYDRENMKKCWREFYKTIFPKGFDDPEYLPLRIEPDSGYYSYGGVKIKFSVE